MTKEPRTCDCCGKKSPHVAQIKQKAQGKANVYLVGTFWWCDRCRQDNNGTWKYNR